MLIIQSAELSPFFSYKNQTGLIVSGKGPHNPLYSYDNTRIHSLMIYSDIIEYIIVSDTQTPLLCCIFFIS